MEEIKTNPVETANPVDSSKQIDISKPAVPSADAAAVSAAAQTGAQNPAPTAGQPLNTGDQGTATAGQSLPGSTGSSTGGSGTPPRPTPASN